LLRVWLFFQVYQGSVLVNIGRSVEAIPHLERAVQCLERAGDLWERNIAVLVTGFCHASQGNLRQADATAVRYIDLGQETGDRTTPATGAYLRGLVNPGALSTEALQELLARSREVSLLAIACSVALGMRALVSNESTAAVDYFTTALRERDQSGIRYEAAFIIPGLLATSLRREAMSNTRLGRNEQRALLRQAGRAARKARFNGFLFPTLRPHALRESALLAAMHSRLHRARVLFDRSLRAAQAIGARHELARTMVARGRLGVPLGWSDAAEQLSQGSALLREIGGEFLAEVDGLPLAAGQRGNEVKDKDRTN
jgi:hypothetical protein